MDLMRDWKERVESSMTPRLLSLVTVKFEKV